jgi:hypothetical protein
MARLAFPNEALYRGEVMRPFSLAGMESLRNLSPADRARLAHGFQASMEPATSGCGISPRLELLAPAAVLPIPKGILAALIGFGWKFRPLIVGADLACPVGLVHLAKIFGGGSRLSVWAEAATARELRPEPWLLSGGAVTGGTWVRGPR